MHAALEQQRLVTLLQMAHDDAMVALNEADAELVVYADSGWRVKDLIAHVAAWEGEMMRSLEAYARGGEYQIADFVDDDTYNERAYDLHRTVPAQEIYGRWAALREELKALVLSLSEAQFEGEMLYPWHSRGTVKRLLGSVVGHQNEHIAHIQAASEQDGHTERAGLLALLDDSHREGRDLLAEVDPDLVVYDESGWRVKDILAHVLVWEEEQFRSLEAYHQGNEYQLPNHETHAYNAAAYERHKDTPFEQLQRSWTHMRERLRDLIRAMPDRHLKGEMQYPWNERGTMKKLVHEFPRHQREHMEHIIARVGKQGTGDSARIIREIEQMHRDTLDVLKGVDENTVIHADTGWTLKDIMAHIVAWEAVSLAAIKAYRLGGGSPIPNYTGYEAFNEAQHRLHKDDVWKDILADLSAQRWSIMAEIAQLSPEQLAGEMTCPSGETCNVLEFLAEVVSHPREHLDEIAARVAAGS